MTYFSNLPKTQYDFFNNGSRQNIVNIFKSVRPISNLIDNQTLYTKYQISDGDRPDIVSYKLYDTAEYYWTFFIVNEFLHSGTNAWPMSHQQLDDYINKKYSGQVIETSPSISRNVLGVIDDYVDSISNRFIIGETLQGLTSGAQGRLIAKDADLSQLIITDITGGSFQDNEGIRGLQSNDFVSSFKAYNHKEAPAYWHRTGDIKRRKVTIDTIIPNKGVPRDTCSYVSYQNLVYENNDKNSNIRVIAPPHIQTFVDTFSRYIR